MKHKLHGVIIVYGLIYFLFGARALIRHSLPCLRFLDQTQSHTHTHTHARTHARTHTHMHPYTHAPCRTLWRSDHLVAMANIYTTQETNIYARSGSWSHNFSGQVAVDLPLMQHSHKGQWADIREIVSMDRPSIRAWSCWALLTLEGTI